MKYLVGCKDLNKYQVARLITELVNAPINVDDYDVIIDDDDWDFDKNGNVFYDVDYFGIVDENREYDYYDMQRIEECLTRHGATFALYD